MTRGPGRDPFPEPLKTIVDQIRAHVPAMSPYFDIRDSLGAYSAKLATRAPAKPAHRSRQKRIARAADAIARRWLPPGQSLPPLGPDDIAALNIVDHHQLLNHPIFLCTNVIANAAAIEHGNGRPVVVLSCSNVSPSNDYLRMGFRFGGRPIPYFSAREYQDSIYLMETRRFDFVDRLVKLKRWPAFSSGEQDFLERYQVLLNSLDYSRCSGHRDQLSVAVRATWPLLFGVDIRHRVPGLLYVSAEELTRDCLVELLTEDNFLTATLLDTAFRRLVIDSFRGVMVAWDEAAGRGTHFFWRRNPASRKLLRLYVTGNKLVPADDRYHDLGVPLERQALIEHLVSGQLIPAVSLQMAVMFYAGMRPLLGPSSLVYIKRFHDGWSGLLSACGEHEEAELVRDIDTSGLIAGMPLFFRRDSGGLRTLYAADVFADGGMSAEYMSRVFAMPFCDLLSVGASGHYELFLKYIPPEVRVSNRLGFDDAAALVHDWI